MEIQLLLGDVGPDTVGPCERLLNDRRRSVRISGEQPGEPLQTALLALREHEGAELRIPFSEQLCRVGGIMCGRRC